MYKSHRVKKCRNCMKYKPTRVSGKNDLPFKKLLWEAWGFFLHCRSSPVMASSHASTLCWKAVGNALSWLCCSWSALSFWHYCTFALVPNFMMNMCQTRQISAQFSMKIARIMFQSITLLNLMSCPKKKLKMQWWRSICKYSLRCEEY